MDGSALGSVLRSRGLVSIAIIAVAIGLGSYAVHRTSVLPATDDAALEADVVHVGATVGGRIINLPVAENMHVARGDLLFQIDPTPYSLTQEQASSELELARAALETQRRVLSTQRSATLVAVDQVRRATANLNLATRTVERLRPLAAKGYIPAQQLDQAETAQRDAEASVRQAREQQGAALRAVDTETGAEATVRARQSALAIARRALDDTAVRAAHGGYVVGLSVLSGEIVAPGQALFTLISDTEWFAVANFRETELRAIAVGNCATVYSMIDRSRPMKGVVQGIGFGVLDTDRVNLPRSLPYVQRSLNWVKVAQRFPVRIRLERPPAELVRLGATASVQVKHGPACR